MGVVGEGADGISSVGVGAAREGRASCLATQSQCMYKDLHTHNLRKA